MASRKTQTRFFLKRARWLPTINNDLIRMPGSVSVASYATFEEAEAERDRRERELRDVVNPFSAGAFAHYWTHLDEPRLRDWLLDRGIEPPEKKKGQLAPWRKWWEQKAKKFRPTERAAVWEALDKVRFYTVEEDIVRPTAFGVVEVSWVWNGDYFDTHYEGGALHGVYWTRKSAEARCKALIKRERAGFVARAANDLADYPDEDINECTCFPHMERIRAQSGSLAPRPWDGAEGTTAADAQLFEVIEFEVEGLAPPASCTSAKPKGDTQKKARQPALYVVQQQTLLVSEMDHKVHYCAGSPERGFATERAAQAYLAEIARTYRSVLNPFAYNSVWATAWRYGPPKEKLLQSLKTLGIDLPSKPDLARNREHYHDRDAPKQVIDPKKWWDRVRQTMTDAHCDAVSEAMGDPGFHKIVKVKLSK